MVPESISSSRFGLQILCDVATRGPGGQQERSMASQTAGLKISKKAFLTSFFILLALMVLTGILTRVLPAGQYDRTEGINGVQVVPGTYRQVEAPDYPVWRWLTAPVEVLGSSDGLQAIVIILFIMTVGGAFAILERGGILKEAVSLIAGRFSGRKYLLLAVVTLFFMSIGSLLGIFEEVIPLVPVAIALSYSLGWDTYVGLGMSILATGFGFSAAIANPFSIGVAQRLAGLPLFSGIGFRFLVFGCVFAFFYFWLYRFAKRTERNKIAAGENTDAANTASMAKEENEKADQCADTTADDGRAVNPARGVKFFGISMVVLIAVILFISLTRFLSDYSMPIIALLFLVAGFGSGLTAGLSFRSCLKAFVSGIKGVLPGAVLILMAMSVKYIIVKGGIMDTILYAASGVIGQGSSSGYLTAALIYLFTLVMNFFIGSATAKAFLLMPILVPIADLAGLSRQIAVQAFAFGDGFSNMLYPTNAVLLISLGLAGVSWTDWFKKTWKLQLATLILTMALLMLAVATGYA